MKVKVGYAEIRSSRPGEFDRAVTMSDLILRWVRMLKMGCMGLWGGPIGSYHAAALARLRRSFEQCLIYEYVCEVLHLTADLHIFIHLVYIYILCCLYHVRLYKIKRHLSPSFLGFGVNQTTLLWSFLSFLLERSQERVPPIDS